MRPPRSEVLRSADRVRRQHLGDREVHGVDQRGAALGPLAGRELRQQAADGGSDADGVSGGIDRDAIIGGPDHGLDGLAVAGLADDHRGGTAAQGRTQAVGKTLEMAGDLRGRHQRAVPFDMIEHELDRRLIGLDAPGAALQQTPGAGGEQGRLARARHPGHQGQAAPQVPGLDDLVLDTEFLEARRRAGQNPERDVDGKTARGLHRGEVAAETPEDAARLGHGVGTVDGPAAAQDAFAGGVENARAQPPSATPSRAAPVARASLPSTSMKAGAPVWKEMSEAPRFAAHSRKTSSRSTGNTCAAPGQYESRGEDGVPPV